MKRLSILIPPVLLLMTSLNPRASARDALNFSPPDKELTSLSLPVYESNTESTYEERELNQTEEIEPTYEPSADDYDLEINDNNIDLHLMNGENQNEQEEWQTLDMFDANRSNEIDRKFTPVSVRYVRLYVVGPSQSLGPDATRIYEFDLW